MPEADTPKRKRELGRSLYDQISESAVPCEWDAEGNPINWKRDIFEGYDSILDMPASIPEAAMVVLRKRLLAERAKNGLTVISDDDTTHA